jgi:hypothetical protein
VYEKELVIEQHFGAFVKCLRSQQSGGNRSRVAPSMRLPELLFARGSDYRMVGVPARGTRNTSRFEQPTGLCAGGISRGGRECGRADAQIASRAARR